MKRFATVENWNAIWETRGHKRSFDEIESPFQRKVYDSISKNVKNIVGGVRGKNILEIGCGSGYLSMIFLSMGAKKVTLMDTSKTALAYSRTLAEYVSIPRRKVRYVCSDCRRLPFPTDTFDLVHSTGLLEHFSDDEILGIMNECRRVLKMRGDFIAIVPNMFSVEILWRMIRDGGKGTERILSNRKLLLLMRNAGFKKRVVKRARASVVPSFLKKSNSLTTLLDRNIGFLDYLKVCYGKKL